MRLYSQREYTAYIGAERLGVSLDEMRSLLQALRQAGYLVTSTTDEDGDRFYTTTLEGNALAQASLAKPIKRATAERQLSSVISRTKEYDADPSKLLSVESLFVFGSYLDPEANELGDVDLAIRILRRHPIDQHKALREQMVRESGRRFSSYLEELFWPSRELILILKARTPTINITGEDVALLTSRFDLVYSLADDTDAAPLAEGAARIEL